MAEHFRASGTVLLLTWRRLCSVFSISAGRTETTTEVPPLLLGVGVGPFLHVSSTPSSVLIGWPLC